ncbi:hypothetical protein [Methanothrix sp.]|uniref:hypothetical protein n=1 Tax=Methanothrix sp. TaxID=90426 RepID=UPI003BB66345
MSKTQTKTRVYLDPDNPDLLYTMWTSASSTGSRAARLIHTGRALARNGLREIAVRELKARGARAGKAEIRAGWWWRCWVFSR